MASPTMAPPPAPRNVLRSLRLRSLLPREWCERARDRDRDPDPLRSSSRVSEASSSEEYESRRWCACRCGGGASDVRRVSGGSDVERWRVRGAAGGYA